MGAYAGWKECTFIFRGTPLSVYAETSFGGTMLLAEVRAYTLFADNRNKIDRPDCYHQAPMTATCSDTSLIAAAAGTPPRYAQVGEELVCRGYTNGSQGGLVTCASTG
jgi:hypothetical protein